MRARMARAADSCACCRPDIRIEGHELLLHGLDLVSFGHSLRHGKGTGPRNSKENLPRILLDRARNLTERLAIMRSIGRLFDASEHDAVPVVAGMRKPILPTGTCFHLAANLRPDLCILEPAQQIPRAFGRVPRMNKSANPKAVV